MTVTYTGNLKLGLPTTGTESGTWGDVVNQQITTLVDQAISGTVSLTSMTDADYTLTNGNGNAANEARYMALLVPSSLTLTAARNIIVPNTSKMYIVQNSTTGTSAVTVKTSAGTGIAVPKGSRALLYCDGTNVVEAHSYISAITLGTALGVASGGTGAATLTANNVLLGNGTSALQVVAPGTSGNILQSNGTTWQSATASFGGGRSTVYTTAGTGTFTIPAGVTNLKITVIGGGGGSLNTGTWNGGGGGGGGAILFVTGVTPLNTLSYTVGAAGAVGGSGGTSSVSSGTQTINTVSATGGAVGGATGTSATAGIGSGTGALAFSGQHGGIGINFTAAACTVLTVGAFGGNNAFGSGGGKPAANGLTFGGGAGGSNAGGTGFGGVAGLVMFEY